MNFRKLLVAGALSCSLALSSGLVVTNQAYAVSFSDTQGNGSEASINKLVSLGVFRNPGENFNPDVKLSRTEFAYMANQVVSLSAGKKLTFNDVTAKNAYYTNFLKMVNNGYLSTSKGNLNVNKGVTYTELAKFLAQNLGLKSSWTNRPIDYLFYLVRKDVLDIDTNLDAIVTREDAAAAFDKFITLKNTFESASGIVAAVTDKGITLNTGNENMDLTKASNISVFVGGQATEAADIQVGSPAKVFLNKKGQVAYYGGEFLDAEDGPIILNSPNWTIGAAGLTKNVNLDAFIASLPTSPTNPLTITDVTNYQKADVEFAGQAFFTNTDDVTALYPYIAQTKKDKDGKRIEKAITVSGTNVTVAFSDAVKATFNAADAVVKLNDKAATLADLTGAVTATFTADKFGNMTTITATKK